MDKFKKKFQETFNTTKRDVNYMIKHKQFKIAKNAEDPEWDEPAQNFIHLYETTERIYNDCKKMVSAMAEIGQQFVVVGDDFVSITTETDPDNIKRIANAYQDIVHKIPEQFYPEAEARLLNEVLGSIQKKLNDMKPLMERMEERSSLKMDYDHYLQKIDNLKTKSNVDANYSIKNQTKLQDAQTKLQQCTDELLDKFYAYEAQRPTFLAYEFQTIRSVQKKFFTALAQSMAGFKITEPSEPPALNITPLSNPAAQRPAETAMEPQQSYGAVPTAVPVAAAAPAPQYTAVSSNPFAKVTAVETAAPVVPTAPSRPAREPGAQYAEALYDFPGTEEDELPLVRGRQIKVINQHESGWWIGEYNGKTGMFPANYVKLI